jgi:hypothetical protein
VVTFGQGRSATFTVRTVTLGSPVKPNQPDCALLATPSPRIRHRVELGFEIGVGDQKRR